MPGIKVAIQIPPSRAGHPAIRRAAVDADAVGYRNPDLLADMARTVDHISGGRVILGVGAGFRQEEAAEYGFAFGSPADRVRELGEALARIERRLARLNPPPIRRIPILVAADGPGATLVAARHADIWHSFAEEDEFAERSARFDDCCRQVGRDPASVTRSVFADGDPWTVGPRWLERGVGMVVLMTRGPRFPLDELRRWLAWRDEVTA